MKDAGILSYKIARKAVTDLKQTRIDKITDEIMTEFLNFCKDNSSTIKVARKKEFIIRQKQTR